MIKISPVIAIDGPSGAGKGTLCKAIAKILKWNLLDSGAIYRVMALSACYHKTDLNSEEKLVSLAKNLNIRFFSINNCFEIFLEKENVSRKIRNQEIANIASHIASFPRVRKMLLYLQRTFRIAPGLVADGRDMGTIVFPDAPVKIFLDASLKERANRRMLQLQENNFNVSFKYLLSEIKERDKRDRNRTIAKLVPADDALILDSTNLTIEQVIAKTLQYLSKKVKLV